MLYRKHRTIFQLFLTVVLALSSSKAQTKLVGSATSVVGSATVVNPGNTNTKIYVEPVS